MDALVQKEKTELYLLACARGLLADVRNPKLCKLSVPMCPLRRAATLHARLGGVVVPLKC